MTVTIVYHAGPAGGEGGGVRRLRLCDGGSTVEGVAVCLGGRYSGVRTDDITAVPSRLADQRVVEWT